MGLLNPIVPILGPLGPVLAASDLLIVGLALFGLAAFGLSRIKPSIFETSRGWVGATIALSLMVILFRGMDALCSCGFYSDASGNPTQLVPFTYLLVSGSFFAILYNFNVPIVKKYKWVISVPLSIPLALFSNLFFPLVPISPPWVYIELLLFSPLGALYSGITYEHAVLHMGDYRARLRRFLQQTDKAQKDDSLPLEKEGFIYFTYGLLGKRITKLLPFFKGLKQVLLLAGMKVGYKAYVSLMAFAGLVAFIVSFFVWLVLLSPAVGLGDLIGISFASQNIVFTFIAAFLMSIVTGLVTLGFFYAIPFFKLGGRRQRLDQYLPFTSSYMTVLASAGVTPERILRSTSEKDPRFMLSDEIANVVGRIDLLGFDVIHALNAEVERSPSTSYQDLLRGFAGVIRTGGDMKKFFQGITDHFFQKRHLSVQSFLDTL
ncbi:MAG TPA: type II secretion system F family protein, partial [Candidatus Binatus sp.]|nr:type II secretion system F family protein [Candidatus Binatus sp.]